MRSHEWFSIRDFRRLAYVSANIARDSLHRFSKRWDGELAGFHTFRRFRESILQMMMSEARTLLIDFWMGTRTGICRARPGRSWLHASDCGRTAVNGQVGTKFWKHEMQEVVAAYVPAIAIS